MYFQNLIAFPTLSTNTLDMFLCNVTILRLDMKLLNVKLVHENSETTLR